MFEARKKSLRIVDCVQNSDEWYAARLGKATASRISDVVAGTGAAGTRKIAGGGATREKYLIDLVLERVTGKRAEGFTSKAVRDGIEREAEAAARYEFNTKTKLAEVGFVLHPTIDFSGASPDRLAGDVGLVQIKCPEPHTHYAYICEDALPINYRLQMQWEMACAKALWCDFVSYHPEFPISKRLHTRRVNREPALIVELERAVREFLAEAEAAYVRLMADEEIEAVA